MSHNYHDDHDDDEPSQQPVLPSGFLKLDEIKGETQTRWLWPDKIPVGHVTIMTGEASSGKSLLAAEIAARVSSGTGWSECGEKPGTEKPAGSVLIAHSNQHENLLLKGRLLAAGADPARVAVMNRDDLEFERDIGALDPGDDPPEPAEASLIRLEGALVEIRDARLVVIDHLLGWLGRSRLRPEELAQVFNRLTYLAARYRVALVVLWRLEKGGRAAQTRALDALAGIAPVVWLLANDTYSSHARSAVCAQNRLGPQSESLAFRIAGDRLMWQEAVRQLSADDLVAARTADRHERRQAGQWLLDLLSQGSLEARQLWHEARECGLAERTMRRAAAELGLHPTKDGKRNVWLWGLCSEKGSGSQDKETRGQGDKEMNCEAQAATETTTQNVAALPTVGSLAGANESLDNQDGYPTNVGGLANAAVVQVELRRDAPPSVSTLPPAGTSADVAQPPAVVVEPPSADVAAPPSADVAAPPSAVPPSVAVLPAVGNALAQETGPNSQGDQNVAALPSVGSLAQAESAKEILVREPNVADLVCSNAEADAEEQKLLAEVATAAAAMDDSGDRAEESETSAVRERRLRRERCALERTMRICRDG